eukprot:1190949-Prorocentrum_minimum.AAC.1
MTLPAAMTDAATDLKKGTLQHARCSKSTGTTPRALTHNTCIKNNIGKNANGMSGYPSIERGQGTPA